jgi:YD repeat-containing protein
MFKLFRISALLFALTVLIICETGSPRPAAAVLVTDPPEVAGDSFSIHSTGGWNIFANDTTFGLNITSAVRTSNPAHGTATIVVGEPPYVGVTYQVTELGYVGTDTFDYYICTSAGCSGSATVTVNVTNDAPSVSADFKTVGGWWTPVTLNLFANDFDPEDDSFDLSDGLVCGPLHGTISRDSHFAWTFHRSVGDTWSGYVGCSYRVVDSLGRYSGWTTVGFWLLPIDDALNAGRFCPSAGGPVNVTNGNMWLSENDYALPGVGENLSIDRFYNSVGQYSGLFGFGWSTKYDESILIYPDGGHMLGLRLPDGRVEYFGRSETTGPFLNLVTSSGDQIVSNTDGSFTVNFKDGRTHQFDTIGTLLWQKDRNGNQTTLTYNPNGQLTAISDPFGRILTLTPNADGTIAQISDSYGTIATYEYYPGTTLLNSVIYPDSSKYTFEYDSTSASGKVLLKTVKDALDNILETHLYDSLGRATTSELHGGVEKYILDYSHLTDADPYTLVTDGLNRVTKYYFDKSKYRNVVTKTEGVCGCGGGGSEVTTFEYDSKLNLAKKTDALGNDTTYTYSSSGDLLTQTDVLGTQAFTYNSLGEVLTATDRMGGVWTITYDPAGNLLTTKDPLDNVTTVVYPTTNNKGLPDSIKDARSNETKFKWFPTSGLLQEIEDPYGKKTSFTYDARGRADTVTNALGHVTDYNYFDDSQRKVEMIYPNLDKITYKYDIRRLLESITDERGKVTSYEFDSAHRLRKITDPLGHIQEFGYDLMSNMTSYKDPLGNVTTYTPDDFNRLKQIDYPAAEAGATPLTEMFEYDKVGRIKKHYDTANRLTEYSYDDVNRTNTVTNAELEVTTLKYNQRFQTIEVKDALNQVYQFSYDPLGRALSQTRAGGTMSYQFDEVGNIKKRTDYAGRVTNYTFDKLNRLTKVEYANAPGNQTPNQESVYGYDDISRLISATNEAGTVAFNYDDRNRLKNTTDVFGHLIEYEYELTPTVNQKRLKFDGTMYAVYNFDDVGRLSSLVNSSDNTTISFGYDNEDKPISRTYPNGVTTTYDYFNNDLLKRLKDVSGTATLFDRQYTYNSAQQIENITEPTTTRIFTYDLVDRLKTVTASNNQNESYNYDDVGNRTSSHLSNTYTYSPFNKLTTTQTVTYAFDANGNTVGKSEGGKRWMFLWDHENRLAVARDRKTNVRYRYDALGRRVQRVVGYGRENTKFIYDGLDVVADDNSGTLTKYQNGPGIDNKLRVQTGTDVKYFLADHLGSTNGLADSSGSYEFLRFIRQPDQSKFPITIPIHRPRIRQFHRSAIQPRKILRSKTWPIYFCRSYWAGGRN